MTGCASYERAPPDPSALLAARARRALNQQLLEVVSRSHDFFGRARALGAATALDDETAAIQATQVRLAALRLVSAEARAAQALNTLLGLPPEVELSLEPNVGLAVAPTDVTGRAQAWTEQALLARPDLRELLAEYERTGADLRLAVAMQWPEIAVGTSIELTFGLFSDYNDPVVQTALIERERMGRQVAAAIHQLCAEVHDAVLALEQSQQELSLLNGELAQRLDESLRLLQLAFGAQQVAAGEILLAHGQVLDARVAVLEARIDAAKRAVTASWVVGENRIGEQR